MFIAVAVESKKHPKNQNDYTIWFLKQARDGSVIGIGKKTKEELVKNLFENYRQTGETNWKCFKKDAVKSTPVELTDFIGKNHFENTHFGNLPTLEEFQRTLHALEMNLEMKRIA